MRYFVCLTLLCLLTVAAVSANTPVTEGTYQYSVAPVNEGEGPVPFGSGILTDGTAANPLGETARWPFSMNIRDVTISFDLLRTYELAEIFLASHCPNEYWGIRIVSISYSVDGASFQKLGDYQWYGTQHPLQTSQRLFELRIPQNITARYVKVNIRNLHPGQNMPLSEVIFYSKGPGESDPAEGSTILRTGQYLYSAAPNNEGKGPIPFQSGLLTDGPSGDTAKWNAAADKPGTIKIVFDLLGEYPLEKIRIISNAPNEWWGIKAVSLGYRPEAEPVYFVAGNTAWYGPSVPLKTPERNFELTFPIDPQNNLARFVKLEIASNWWINTPLTEVEIYVKSADVTPAEPATEADLLLEMKKDFLLVDRYGQYLYEDWPGKITSDEQLIADAQREAELLQDVRLDLERYDQYGGLKGEEKYPATGFFYLKEIDGRWWFITPEGNKFFPKGIDAVAHINEWGYGTPVYNPDGTPRGVFQELPDKERFAEAYVGNGTIVNFVVANLIRKYGDSWRERWADVTYKRMLDWGFNTHSKWTRSAEVQFPYITVLNPNNPKTIKWAVDPFDPGFPKAVEEGVRDTLLALKDDPWLLGHTFQSEKGWDREIVQEVLQSGPELAAKNAFVDFIKERYKNIMNVITAWGIQVTSFEELREIPIDINKVPAADVSDFIRHASERYYCIVSKVIKRYDPNHLLLGSSLTVGWHSSEEWETGGIHLLDAISFDTYTTSPAWIKTYEKYEKPILLLEFSFSVAARGLTAIHAPVNSQKERGLYYRYVVEQLAASPYFVGFGYFLYYDQAVTRRNLPDGENCNFGLVNQQDQPYYEMLEEVKKTNHRIYEIHAGKIPPVTREELGLQ